MIYKNFRFNIIVRIVILIATIYAFVSVVGKHEFLMTTILLAVLVILQAVSIIHYIEKINRIVVGFLEAIRLSDFSQTFHTEGLGSSFDSLKKAFNKVIDDFKKIRNEKEIHYFYLQNIIAHIEVGIIAFQKNGTVEVVNTAMKNLFKLNSIENINDISKISEDVKNTFVSIKPGENKLVKLNKGAELLQLSVYATEFVINEKNITLISLKNIQAELEEQELEAWQKLIRVLTHEIMNSIAPIASLTSTANLMVQALAEDLKIDANDENNESIEDIGSALQTIHKRSTGLIHFVEQYRNLTRIPKPNFKIYKIKTQFDAIFSLLEKDIKDKNINLKISVIPEQLELTADEQLIEQVLINMVKNSIQALENTDNKQITLKAYINNSGRRIVNVIDNGQGIIQEVGDKIFIPFFTTKSNGSGIGLSLSKQIMRLHSGNIKVDSVPKQETCFTLTF